MPAWPSGRMGGVGEWPSTKDGVLPVLAVPFGEASDMWGSQARRSKVQNKLLLRIQCILVFTCTRTVVTSN